MVGAAVTRDRLGRLRGGAAVVGHRQRDGVGAGRGVGVRGVDPGAGGAVTEVPGVRRDRAVRVGRGGPVEGTHQSGRAGGERRGRRLVGRRRRGHRDLVGATSVAPSSSVTVSVTV